MLDLTARFKTLKNYQTRFYDSSLNEELSHQAFETYNLSDYSDKDITMGLSAWSARTADEYRSMVDFSHLLQDVTVLGLSFDAISAVVRLVRDEARHVELCKRMVETLGSTSVINHEVTWSGADPDLPPLERVLYRLSGSLCVGETLSVHLIDGVRKNTVDPLAQSVSKSILQDESFHSQVGWVLFSSIYPSLDEETQAKTRIMIHSHIEGAKQVVVNEDEAPESVATNPFGYLPNAERNQIYQNTMENVIVKKFAYLGIEIDSY